MDLPQNGEMKFVLILKPTSGEDVPRIYYFPTLPGLLSTVHYSCQDIYKTNTHTAQLCGCTQDAFH